MSRNRYVFISESGVVVQVIAGNLDAAHVVAFLNHYRDAFGAASVFEVTDAEVAIWIGGPYDSTSGVFSPPPSPEPEAEPIVEEPINDDAPII